MITDAIVSAFLAAFNALFSLIPDMGTEPSNGAFDGIAQQISAFNNIFPLVTLVEIIGITIGLEIAIYIWDLTIYVYHQIWGSD